MPLDKETIFNSVKKTNKVIVLYEATRSGGVGAEVAALISEDVFGYLDGPVLRISAPDTPVPYSPPLEEYYLPQVEDVVEAAEKLAAY
jgi:2-oxoisovalerate dehydrogenase E1 component beta subunit